MISIPTATASASAAPAMLPRAPSPCPGATVDAAREASAARASGLYRSLLDALSSSLRVVRAPRQSAAACSALAR